jgi:hypothetical protein
LNRKRKRKRKKESKKERKNLRWRIGVYRSRPHRKSGISRKWWSSAGPIFVAHS